METNDTYTAKEIFDVAIVGGGVSGIYSAWRLMHCDASTSEILRDWASYHPDGKLKIGVFERSDRIGGRLLSLVPPGMPNLRAELGAMHFTSNQMLLRSPVASICAFRYNCQRATAPTSGNSRSEIHPLPLRRCL